MTIVSCAKETLESDNAAARPDNTDGYVRLSIGEDDMKASMNGLKIVWTEGDSIRVNGTNYPVQLESGGGAYVLAPQAETYDCFFPADVWSGNGPLVQPAQFYKSGSFGLKANYMHAVSQTKTIVFSHMFGILKLNIKGTGTIASVNVRDNAGGSMCGQYKMSEGKLVPDTEVQYDNVTLNCKTGSNGGTALTATGVDFHIVVPARTYAKGFTITISEVGGHAMVLNSTTPRTIQAGHILSTPSIAYNYPSDQIYEYHLDNLVFGSDPVGGRKGFLCPGYKDGFELCTCLTDNSEQAGTANYSINSSTNGDFAGVGTTFARSRNIQSWKKVYYTRECHGYMACGYDGVKKTSFKFPALTNAGAGYFIAEYSWKMAFVNGRLPQYGIQILHTTSTPGKILKLYVDGVDKTGSMADGSRWCSEAGSDGKPYLKDATNTEERILIRPDDFKDNKWHDIKLVMGMATKESVLEFSPFGLNTDQPFFIDDVRARRTEYPEGSGTMKMQTPSTTTFTWEPDFILQPSFQFNPNSSATKTFLKNYIKTYNIKYIDISTSATLLFNTWGVSSMTAEGWATADKKIKEFKDFIDELGIKIWSIHLPYSSLKEGNVGDSEAFAFCSTSESVRQSAVNRTKVIMTHLAVLSPKYMLIHPHNDVTTKFNSYSGILAWKTYYKDQGVLSYKALVSHAASITCPDGSHPVLIIENVGNTGTTSESLTANVNNLKWFCEQVPGLGVCLDTSHALVNNCNSVGNDPSTLITSLGSLLKHIHIHGGNPANDKDLHVMPGYKPGTLDLSVYGWDVTDAIQWGKFYKTLIDKGYRGTFCYEYSSPEYNGDFRDCIANFHNIYHNYFDLIIPAYKKQ